MFAELGLWKVGSNPEHSWQYYEAMNASPMSRALKPYEGLASQFLDTPPKWLAEHLMDWTWTLQGIRGGQEYNPTRSELIKQLKKADASIDHLQELLKVPQYTAFLQLASAEKLPPIDDLDRQLGQLRRCVWSAYKAKQLTGASGKAPAGRGKVKLPGELSAMAWCAVFVAETVCHFAGKYPASSNAIAARAAEAWWVIVGGERSSWGTNPLAAWRRHFQTASEPGTDQLNDVAALRKLYREHLRMRAATAQPQE